jgi:Zn ribbon nucleic-acid-binding protein
MLTMRQLRPVNRGQYLGVNLSGKAHYIHRLVLMTYVGPCPPRHESRHLNDDKLDNRLENLCWGTQSENNKDRSANGIHHYGPERHTHCPNGHLIEGRNANQRFCIECRRERGRARRAAKTTCPQGHPFDGLRYRADGTVRQRYCIKCAHAALDRGRRASRSHCPRGHLLEGNAIRQRYCKTCNNDRNREAKAKRSKTIPCQSEGCNNIKTAGQANRYCGECRAKMADMRKVRARERTRKWHADRKAALQ